VHNPSHIQPSHLEHEKWFHKPVLNNLIFVLQSKRQMSFGRFLGLVMCSAIESVYHEAIEISALLDWQKGAECL
jgi:hypothetical protein